VPGVDDDRRIFVNPPTPDHPDALVVLEAALSDPTIADEAANALVGLTLRDGDREFVEARCVELGRQLPPGSPLLGLAGLCIGHLARRFGYVSDDAAALVVELARRAQADPSDVDTRAVNGLDDVRQFSDRDL
jgi:hypothetical protein